MVPVLVRAYTSKRTSRLDRDRVPRDASPAQVLPPISSYAFADILREADCVSLQEAIDGIAQICAKNHMSLAEEYALHLPPIGEITAATSHTRSNLYLPGMRRALTSVPEASSGSSEGSRDSRKKASIFSFRNRKDNKAQHKSRPMRRVRIGSMGRTLPVNTTTALTLEASSLPGHSRNSSNSTVVALAPQSSQRTSSAAESSLQRLLAANGITRRRQNG